MKNNSIIYKITKYNNIIIYVNYVLLDNGSRYRQLLIDGSLSLSVDGSLLNFRIQCH